MLLKKVWGLDNFSTYSSAMLIQSEQTKNLKAGLILLISTMHHPGPIIITTEFALGFLALFKDTDTQLTSLNITLNRQDEFYQNFNTVVDPACRELETKICKLAPKGGSIKLAQFTAAILLSAGKASFRHTK